MKFNNVLDNSMISDFRNCPRYFQFRHIELLTPKSDSNKFKAAFGTALHEGLEVFYSGGTPKEMDDAFIESWLPYEGQDDTGIRTITKGLLICEEYRARFANEDFTVLHTETGGAFSLGKFLILFKCDGVVRLRDKVYVFEHKTSAHRGFLITKPNSQLDTYITGISELLNMEVGGALFNQIYFRKGRKNENQADTISFVREETARTSEELDDWKRDTIQWGEAISKCSDNNFYPKNTNSCTAYGGCQFLSVCKLPVGDTQESVKNGMYDKELWEPWEGARDIKDPILLASLKSKQGEA